MFASVYILISVISSCIGRYTIISSKPANVTFKYMEGVTSESNLHECEYNEACNIIHNRFWMPILTERLCRCSNGKECPWKWTRDLENNSSMILNNRAILQFCTSTRKLSTCTHKQAGATVYGKSNSSNTFLIPHDITINCTCPKTHYWKLQKYTYGENTIVQAFKCVKKKKCDSYDFCGHIRSDLFSTYYRCTCPQKNICIYKDRTQENVQELLYSGPAYKAYCYPF